MARRPYRPGRTLVVFFLGLAITYGLVAVAGTWKPELGLDLQGGTRITLTAKGNPSSESLEEARSIIDQRVNGSGVAEAEVTTQSNQFLIVEIPGERRRDLIEVVQRQAQLRFRLVACSDADPTPCASQAAPDPGTQPDPSEQPSQEPEPGTGVTAPADPTPTTPDSSASPTDGANRPPVGFADQTPSKTPSPSDNATPNDGASADGSETPADPSASPTDGETTVPDAQGKAKVEDELAWQDAPTGPEVQLFNQMSCSADGVLLDAKGEPAELIDDPNKPLVACSVPEENADGEVTRPASKFLLSKSVIEGTELDSASNGQPDGQFIWVVNLEIGGQGKEDFTKISEALRCPGGGPECDLFAIVLDGQVISSPYMEGLITNGQAQISGDFTETTSKNLATSLKFGALPIAFEDDATAETVGPSLAGNQLSAGLIAGAFGLGLVLLYCLLYYRGLGLVVVASLLVAAAATYALVLLLSETANFTLTLPGIAGLIIAVGVTADSFIIFFERIRDEMREGKSMRVAVETGWVRAKVTRLAAQVVSLLSAAVLYIFATGAVKGFGFALGLSTIIDLAILFWFTKPMVSWLARFKFFNSGHRLSGLSRGTLGMDAVTMGSAGTVGGKA